MHNKYKTATLKTLLMLSITSMIFVSGGIISVYAAPGNLLLEINNPTPESDDSFGRSIVGTIDGNILVGAHTDNTGATDAGTVYLFDSTDGSLLLTINNPTPASGDVFGASVASTIDGNILVGAELDDTGATDAGTVYLFDSTDGSLLLTINNPAPNVDDRFGSYVAVTPSGNILIGALFDDTGATDAGTVYLFDGTDGSLLLTINPPEQTSGDYFGQSFAVTPDGNILVGAHNEDTGNTNAGSVYLFDGTTGSLLLEINNPTPESYDYFGFSVAATINGDILVGAERDNTGATDTGSVYLFDGTTGNLLLTINNPTPESSDWFSIVATMSDGNILVGARNDNTGTSDTGSVYLFDGTTGSLLLEINNPTPEMFDNFGYYIAGTHDGNILISAIGDDTGAENAGFVYIFEGISLSTLTPTITSLVADDPNDLDEIYSVDDTITITFDSDTNTPGGVGVQTKAAVNDLYVFTELLGESYTGQWIMPDTFEIIITNTTGASPPIISSTTVTPTGIMPILSDDETSSPSSSTSPVLSGDFGIIELFCGQPESFYNVIGGTESPDYLVGTNSPDLIFGNGGNDMIYAIGENNCIYAGDGNDFVFANKDGNIVYGGTGDDSILLKGTGIAYGEDGDDTTHIIKPSVGHLIDGGNDYDLCTTNTVQIINTANCEITVP